MPEVDGIQLLHYMKSEDSLRSVPVIMMSSIEQGETVYECVQGGAEEYLVKPVTRKEVQHMWQHVLRKRSAAATVPQAPLAAAQAAQAEAEPRAHQGHLFLKQERRNGSESSVEPLRNPDPVASLPCRNCGGAGVQQQVNPVTAGTALPEDFEATHHFLQLMQESRQNEIAEVVKEIEALDADTAVVVARLQDAEDEVSHVAQAGPASKRRRTTEQPSTLDVDGCDAVNGRLTDLEGIYFQRRSSVEGAHLDDFARDLSVLARGSTLSVEASLRAGDIASPQEMVS